MWQYCRTQNINYDCYVILGQNCWNHILTAGSQAQVAHLLREAKTSIATFWKPNSGQTGSWQMRRFCVWVTRIQDQHLCLYLLKKVMRLLFDKWREFVVWTQKCWRNANTIMCIQSTQITYNRSRCNEGWYIIW